MTAADDDDFGFEWDEYALSHLVDATPDEVRQVLKANRPRMPKEGISMTTGQKLVGIFGTTDRGRMLLVVLRRYGPRRRLRRIVGAREMTDAEKREFESWEEDFWRRT